MDIVAQLVAAIIALWGVLTTVAATFFKFLMDDRKARDAEWRERVAKLEIKLDQSAEVILRQNESMQKQIDAQAGLVAQQQQMITAMQSLTKAPPA